MHPRILFRSGCRLLVAAFLLFPLASLSQAKNIRLRNELIETDSGTNRAVMAVEMHARAATSGLFVLQFNGPLDPARRIQLRQAGVELLQYVPEDSFIAKFNKVSPASVGALSFVRWVGPYRQDHKIHARLAAIASAAAQTNQNVSVNILLSPSATPGEIAAVRSHLSALHHESHLRQGTIVRGELSPGHLDALAQSGAVLWIERAPRRKLVDEFASKLIGGDDGNIATPTITQQLGFDGRGVTVCVADTGLDTGNTNSMHPDLHGRVTGFQFYGDLPDGSDGYGHGTHCAGIVAGNAATGETDPDTGALYGLGVASGANLFIERIFDENAGEASPFPSDETLTHDAVRHGAKIGSNSWGDDVQGEYNLDASQFDELVRDADAGTAGDQPYILEFSAGNAGPGTQTIGSPASAKNVIATGASENVTGTLAATYGLYAEGPDSMCDFSSRGPCADGRIKPDLVAPGSWIASAASSAAPNEAAIAWTAIDDYYVFMGGTSMSGPAAAGAAAVFVQFYKTTHTNAVPSPALVKAALINSADELDESNGGPGPVPNNDEGWGRINLPNIIVTNTATAPRFYQYLDQTVWLTNSQVYAQHIFVQGADQPLKITLAYTDVPGFPGALPALVNDLDLEVTGPDGTLYRGNQFGAGESVPNAPTPDKLNNVEGVYLSQPAPGDYVVRVRGSKIVQNSLTNSTTAIVQDFALVSSGNFTRPGTGIILLDRPRYTAPSLMQIEVLDAARAASNTVSVLVTNLTAHRWTTNLLHALGNYGAFTGAVATVTSVASAGQIQIANGDALEADYVDAGTVKRTATATADLIPPVISSVAATTDLGVLTITWQTSEPANSLVRYGTNSGNLNLAVTNAALVTSHLVKLTRLIPGKTYYFLVGSSDAAANSVTNNNSGANYTFTGLATPTVLLVDDYDNVAEENAGSTVIPDSSYTNVLSMAGVSYGFWKVTARGFPQLADLTPFPVVIWRTTDDQVNYGVDADGLPDPSATNNTINAQEQFIIQSYLNGGGSFFMSAMDILTQLGDVSFRRNVLQVAGFEQNPDPPAPCSDCDEDFGVPAILGAPATVANGMAVTLDYGNYPSFDDGIGDIFGPDFSCTFTPSANATPITFESASAKPCGMSFPDIGMDSPGRVVFLAFPFDAIPTNNAAPNNAQTLLRNIISFLAPGVNGIGMVQLDNSVYTTNDVVTVQVGDSDLIGAGQTTVAFAASSRTNRVTVNLFETTHPGLFKGSITLVAGNAGTNQLVVHNGDTITATYADASRASNVTATAIVDTVPPAISQVAAVTDYSNAKVTWTTSKPADSSVQYSESPLPDRSSYGSLPVTNHALTISGLSANRIYFYQVVSRDLAGNTTVDDNHGSLYQFKTLKAPQPPWFDDLESGAPGWTVIPDTSFGTEINWTLGTPNNGLATSAFSGTNAWGSNLNHTPFEFEGSFLYSPVIDLSGMAQVTLTFWDNYNLTSGLEFGEFGVSTNSSTPPANVPTVESFTGDASGGWEEETIDLTPFAGKTVQLVWYYAAFSFEGTLNGWLVDDISITGVVAGGNISITKNLGQGTWALSSLSAIGTAPIQSGIAPSVTLSNLPAGQYVVQFSDVPSWQTPRDQTNTLVAGGSLNFNGNYTFLDANQNNISDDWERDYFGAVVTNRTQLTDKDHDGMTDYAEFIAGTNPTNAASRFYFTGATFQTNHLVRITWTAVTNRLYQVNSATNFANWQPVTDWLQASNNPTMNYTTTNTIGRTRYYRVQVRP